MKMAGNKILLDTNIISALFKGEEGIADKIDNADIVFIPAIVVGEHYYGSMKSVQIEKNIQNIEKLIERYSVLKVDEKTAKEYGIIKAELEKKGRRIPENDIWIAALAKQYDLTLISRDSHFDEIHSISKEKW